jgi:hypothetical protein
MPFTGNHWLVAGLVALAVILTGARPQRLFPAARLIVLVFYLFAAFAKLNTGFFDPTVSCAVFYANQSLASFDLPTVSSASSWALIPIWSSVLIELSIPVLLMIRRTRYFGVLLGSVFHVAISVDLAQHFYDFTAVLIPLFVLFLPSAALVSLGDLFRRLKVPTGGAIFAIAALVSLVVLSNLTPNRLSAEVLQRVPFVLWIPVAVVWLLALVRVKAPGESLAWHPGWGSTAVVLAVLNGLTPYTEVKTAYGFNMYANLRTAGGETNHLILSGTLPIRDGYEDPVEIIASTDPGLEAYRELDLLVAYPQLRRYLVERPNTSLSYSRGGSLEVVESAGAEPEFTDPGPWWWRYFPLRALDQREPPRCQDVFLVAL